MVHLDVDGTSAPVSSIDAYAPLADAAEMDFGSASLSAGTTTLRFTVTGKNPSSGDFAFAADQIRLR